MNDLSTRDYDVNSIGKEDVRFLDCKREGILLDSICFCVTALGVALAYILSPTTANAAATSYLFGYPVWVMVPALLFMAESVFFIIYASKIMKRPSLDARVINDEEVK